MLLKWGVAEDSWESLGLQEIQPVNPKGNQSWIFHWKDWGWSWNSNTLTTWWKEPTHWKRPWCWQRLKAGGERGDRGWDGWMASPKQWTRVWVNSGSWWRTGKPGMLKSMGSQRVGHDWVAELNWLRAEINEIKNRKSVQKIDQIKAGSLKRLIKSVSLYPGSPGGTSDKESACQCRRQKAWFQFLSREDPLEEGTATHFSILAWRIHGQWRLVSYSP